MFVFELFKLVVKFDTILRTVPPECSFGPFFTKSLWLFDRRDKYGIYGYAHQIKEKTTHQHIKKQKQLQMFFNEIHDLMKILKID
jgi:hypothetical protein